MTVKHNRDISRLPGIFAPEEDTLHLVFEAIPQMVWTAAADGKIDYCNRRWCQYTGLTAAQTRQECWTQVLHPDDSADVIAGWEDAMRTGKPYDAECRLRRASDQSWRWHLCRVVPLEGPDGRLLKWFGACADIHDGKLAEEKLRQKTEELAQSNRNLEQFAYVASHDLQEPLRKIMTFTDRLKDRYWGVGDMEKDYFERIQKSALRMKKLIEDLLNYSRVGSSERSFETTDLNAVLGEVSAVLEMSISQSGAQIETGKLPVVTANPAQMHQLFQNLIGNALKFSKKDERPVIRITGEISLVPRGFAEITVRDNGIGFDMKYAERIFRPFQRLHNRSEYEGTGIGLAICQKIIERHGGELSVESRPGDGTAFRFTLPL